MRVTGKRREKRDRRSIDRRTNTPAETGRLPAPTAVMTCRRRVTNRTRTQAIFVLHHSFYAVQCPQLSCRMRTRAITRYVYTYIYASIRTVRNRENASRRRVAHERQ